MPTRFPCRDPATPLTPVEAEKVGVAIANDEGAGEAGYGGRGKQSVGRHQIAESVEEDVDHLFVIHVCCLLPNKG